MLVNNILVKSSSGYTDPEFLFHPITEKLSGHGFNITGKRVLELGFGGAFHMGMLYQLHGAKEIYLVDIYAKQKFELCIPHVRNLQQKYADHDFQVLIKNNTINFDKDKYKVHFKELEEIQLEDSSIDLIVSISVFEHLADVGGIVKECSRILTPGGLFLALIDMSDHFQRYPLHMLKFNERTWKKYLNPPSNLNRLRSLDYEKIFVDNQLKVVEKSVTNKNSGLASKMKPYLDKHFQSYPEEVLSELTVSYVLKKVNSA